MARVDNLDRVEVTSRTQWRAWLAENHTRSEGIWLVLYKKHCADRHVRWPDVVQEALCFGWIDSRTRRVDDDRTMLLFSPRKSGSTWSTVNKRHVEELEIKGLIAPPGRKLIDAAKADGSWSFLDDIEALIVPRDLDEALAAAGVRKSWEGTRRSDRKRALYHVKTAKRIETRAARIRQILARLRAGEPPVPG
jgi:uncharacterized protein YdeI (YjbR/CyaY-like superfamily)